MGIKTRSGGTRSGLNKIQNLWKTWGREEERTADGVECRSASVTGELGALARAEPEELFPMNLNKNGIEKEVEP